MSRHVIASGTLTLPLPVAQCQMLFTPAGEELWIDEWRPNYVEPRDGATVAGMVFTTGSSDEFTVWTLIDFDRKRHLALYSRVTPALRAGTVEIRCRAAGDALTEVTVRYRMTALGPAGERSLSAYAPASFAKMLEHWRTLILQRLPALASAAIR